jgi:hypothetical protein
LEAIIYFGLAAATTILFTAIICLQRIARKKRASYGTVLAGALSASLVTFVVGLIHWTGKLAFWEAFGQDPKTSPTLGACSLAFLVLALPCTVLASLVVALFHAMHKKDSQKA